MITAENLMKILSEVDGKAEVTVYEGEDIGINIIDEKNRKRIWVRTKSHGVEDGYVERVDEVNF